MGGLPAGVTEASAPTRVLAEEENFRAAWNQGASHHDDDDHNSEFHVALTASLKQQRPAYFVLPETQGYESGGGRAQEWYGRAEQDSGGKIGVSVAKDLGGEGLDESVSAPGVDRQAGFAACLFEKGFAVPTVLDGNLRQQ